MRRQAVDVDRLTTQRERATIMDMQRRIDEMKLWLNELAEAYEIPDPDEPRPSSP
jgi:hypothetical protein